MSFADYGFAIWETFYVTVLSTAFSLVLGLPLGVLLVAGDKDGVLPLPGWLMHILNIIINILRSVPFLILMICVFPLTRAIVGTTVGTKATINATANTIATSNRLLTTLIGSLSSSFLNKLRFISSCTFFSEQFRKEFQISHILQIPALLHLLSYETDGTRKQTNYSRSKSDLHIIRHRSDITSRKSHQSRSHWNQCTHQSKHRSHLGQCF